MYHMHSFFLLNAANLIHLINNKNTNTRGYISENVETS